MKQKADEPLWKTKERKKKRIKAFVTLAILAGGIVLAKKTGFVDQVVKKITYEKPIEEKQEYMGIITGEPHETKVFQPHEHVVFVLKKAKDENGKTIESPYTLWVNRPEGYTVESHMYITDPLGESVGCYYINEVPVLCIADENGEFPEIGTPVLEEELAPVKTK